MQALYSVTLEQGNPWNYVPWSFLSLPVPCALGCPVLSLLCRAALAVSGGVSSAIPCAPFTALLPTVLQGELFPGGAVWDPPEHPQASAPWSCSPGGNGQLRWPWKLLFINNSNFWCQDQWQERGQVLSGRACRHPCVLGRLWERISVPKGCSILSTHCKAAPEFSVCLHRREKCSSWANPISVCEEPQPHCCCPWISGWLHLGLRFVHHWNSSLGDEPRNIPGVVCVLLVQPVHLWPVGRRENTTTLCLKRNSFKVLEQVIERNWAEIVLQWHAWLLRRGDVMILDSNCQG